MAPRVERILSIDVGIKNLAYCIFESQPNHQIGTTRVVKWKAFSVVDDKVNCKTMCLERLTEQLLLKLMDEFGNENDLDLVLIENQPANKNKTMKSISICIFTFFNMMKVMHGSARHIKFVSAKYKLNCKLTNGVNIARNTYRDRKQSAIKLAYQYLPAVCPSSEAPDVKIVPEQRPFHDDGAENDTVTDTACRDLAHMFLSSKKKDDLSDALLQGIYYIEHILKRRIVPSAVSSAADSITERGTTIQRVHPRAASGV
jgi:hypothetical protein